MIIDNNSMLDFVVKLILMTVALIGSIVLHEFAHAYVALINGDSTAKYAGRLTLNPMKHFDSQGLLMLLIIRVGYARPVPINSNNFKKRRLGLFTVSIAGITVNIILSFVFTLFSLLISNIEASNIAIKCLNAFFYYVAFYNLYLCFFNLLPLFPLDGYNMLESVFSFRSSAMRFLRNYGSMILLALCLLSIIVSWIGMPPWLDFLSTYLQYMSNFVHSAFVRFWSWILGI